MSIQTEQVLTIGWRVSTDDVPDYERREWDEEWSELDTLVDRVGEATGDELYREDLCQIENQMDGDTLIIGIPMSGHEMGVDAFIREMDMRARLARDVYEQVMRNPPNDGPYMISWTHVW